MDTNEILNIGRKTRQCFSSLHQHLFCKGKMNRSATEFAARGVFSQISANFEHRHENTVPRRTETKTNENRRRRNKPAAASFQRSDVQANRYHAHLHAVESVSRAVRSACACARLFERERDERNFKIVQHRRGKRYLWTSGKGDARYRRP